MLESAEKTIAKGAFWFSINGWLTRAVGLVTVFFILRHLSLYEYGVVELVLSILPVLSLFLLPGINTVVVADMSNAKGRGDILEMKRTFLNFISLYSLFSVLAWVIVFFGASLIDEFYSEQVTSLIRITSFSFLVAPVRATLGTFFTVYLKFFVQSSFLFLEELIKLVLILLSFFVFDLRASGVILSVVLSSFLASIVLLPAFIPLTKELRSVKLDGWKLNFDIIRFHAKWSMFSNYLNQTGSKLMLWIIQVMLGTEAVALYAVAEGLIGHTTSLAPISKVVDPIIPRYVTMKETFIKIINKGIKYQFIANMIIGIVAFSIFPTIILFLFPTYGVSVSLYKVMLLMLIPAAIAGIFNSIFYATKSLKELFRLGVWRFFLIAITTPIFIKLFGLYGIAYNYVIIVYLYTFWRYVSIKRMVLGFKLSFKDMFTFDEYDRLLIGRVKGKIFNSLFKK